MSRDIYPIIAGIWRFGVLTEELKTKIAHKLRKTSWCHLYVLLSTYLFWFSTPPENSTLHTLWGLRFQPSLSLIWLSWPFSNWFETNKLEPHRVYNRRLQEWRSRMIYCIAIWFPSLNKLVNQSHVVCLMRERYANLSSVVYALGQQLLANYYERGEENCGRFG